MINFFQINTKVMISNITYCVNCDVYFLGGYSKHYKQKYIKNYIKVKEFNKLRDRIENNNNNS